MKRRRWLVASFAVAVASIASCTVFDGLTLPSASSGSGGAGGRGGASSAGSGGAGGAGGGGPIGYLDLASAARLCGLAEDCDGLAASLFLSTGLPIGQASDATFATVTVNQSVCTTLLAGPLPPFQPGVRERRALLEQAVAGGTCAGALGPLPVQVLIGDTAPCDHGSRCADNKESATLCGASVIELECGSTLFPATTCTFSACGIQGCSASVSCSGEVGSICLGTGTFATQINCASEGLTCVGGACVTAEGAFIPCANTDAVTSTCNGQALYACNGFIISDLNCMGTGATCVQDDGTLGIGAYCAYPTTDCVPGSESCNGDTLTLCLAGETTQVDCSSFDESCRVDHCAP
jgi:hypothetical protein